MQEMMGRRASFSTIYHILRGIAGDNTVLASGKLETLQNDQDCLRLQKNSTLRDKFLFQYSLSNCRPHKLPKDISAFNLITVYCSKVGNSTKH